MTSLPNKRPGSGFQPGTQEQLYAMDDLALIQHIAGAKAARRMDQAALGMHMLLYKHERRMRRRVALRVPAHLSHHADTVAEWVLERVMRSALKLDFRGSSVGEWVSWWSTTIDLKVISFWRTTQGQTLAHQDSLPSEHTSDEGALPDKLGEELDIERLFSSICYGEVVQAVISRMSNPLHVAVVRLALWGDDLTSAGVADATGTTAPNVDQIKTRFKREIRAECERRGVTPQ